MSPTTPGPEGTAAFVLAVAQYTQIIPESIRALEERAYAQAVQALIEAVQKAKPRVKVPKWEIVEGAGRAAHYLDVVEWAGTHLNANAIVHPIMGPALEALADLFEQRKAAEERAASLAPFAVFAVVPGAREVVYRDAQHRNQTDPGFYQRADCDLRAAMLTARGFHPIVERADRGYHVVVDGPPALAHALRFWRLDDTRVLATVGAANLKVIFSPFFPYTGAWDWPEKDRERREDATFAAMRANEDAHLALNGGAA